MATFTDQAGRKWNVELTYPAMREVKKRLNIDLGDLLLNRMALLVDILANPLKLIDVLFVLLEEQIAAQNMTEIQWVRGLGAGEYLETMQKAFYQALVDFSPSQDQRKMLTAILAKTIDLQHQMATEGIAQLEALDLKVLQQQPRSGDSVSSPQPSPEPSPPGSNSPYANSM